nr:immunoglobulin heavy chain junction region [Mus musculus]
CTGGGLRYFDYW